MNRYKIVTLVDITRSNANRAETDKIKIGQQANFNTLIQTIGIRSNVQWFEEPSHLSGRLPDNLEGKADHWVGEFIAEQADIFLKEGDPVALLVEDLHGVPVVAGLNNTVELTPAAFQTKGSNTNIWISKLS